MIIGYETTLAIATISVLLLISVYRGRKEIAEALRKGISRLSIASFLAILVFFLLFELLKVYPVEQLYFDENIYLSIALNILHSGNALWCQFGTAYVRQCYVNAVYHDPVGWTVFIALAFALFGVSNAVAFNLELLVGALSVLGVFLLSSVVFEKPEISVLSTLAFALSPELLIWSRSLADIDLPFMMLTVFAFFFFVIFAKKRNRTTLAMFLFSMLLAAYMRIEGILLIPLFLVLLFLYSDQGVRETARKTWRQIIEIINGDTKTILLAFLAFVLVLPQLHYIAIEAANPSYGQPQGVKVISFSNLKNNLPINVAYIFGMINHLYAYPAEFPIFLTPLALIGVALLLIGRDYKNGKGIAILLGLWFLTYFLFYASFYAGAATFGVDVRFMLSILPSLCLFAAFAIYEFSVMTSLIRKNTGPRKKIAFLMLIVFTIVFLIYPFYKVAKFVTITPNQMPQQEQIYQVMQDFYNTYNKVPTNCLVFSATPDIWYFTGRPSAQEEYIFAANQTIKNELSRFKCFVYDYGYWCTVPPQHSGICADVLESFKKDVLSTSPSPNGYNVTYYELLNYTP